MCSKNGLVCFEANQLFFLAHSQVYPPVQHNASPSSCWGESHYPSFGLKGSLGRSHCPINISFSKVVANTSPLVPTSLDVLPSSSCILVKVLHGPSLGSRVPCALYPKLLENVGFCASLTSMYVSSPISLCISRLGIIFAQVKAARTYGWG